MLTDLSREALVTDLVVISLEAWDGVWRRNQHLLSELLRRDASLRVLFVEPAADPVHAVSRRVRPRRGVGLRRAADPGRIPGDPTGVAPEGGHVDPQRLWLFEQTKWLPRRIDPRADVRHADAVRRVARHIGMRAPVLWVNDPSGATLVTRSGWPALYDITDDWMLAERSEREHVRLADDEASLLHDCAQVVVCSPALVASKGADRPVVLIPNAVDVEAYRLPRSRPSDLPDGPIALYVGTAHRDRIDLDLCVATARAIVGRGRLVLVGPAPLDPPHRRRLEEAGVILLGPRDRALVPAYLQHADVLVVPHVVTPFTDSLDPIKLYEYRAVGRPVVSTPVAGFRDDPRVAVADGADFAAAVVDRLPATSHFPDGADPSVPSWRDRAAQMSKVIAEVGADRIPEG